MHFNLRSYIEKTDNNLLLYCLYFGNKYQSGTLTYKYN